MRLPDAGVLRPATPPADFDLDQAVTSLRKFRARTPAGVALAHYGLLPDPMEMLEEAEGILRRWAEVAEKAWRAGEDIAAALEDGVLSRARAASTRTTGPSWRRSTVSIPTRPACAAGWRPPRATLILIPTLIGSDEWSLV